MKVGPNPAWLVSFIREVTKRHMGERWSCDNRGTDWSDTSTNQRIPRIARKCQKLGEARKNSPLLVSEGALPCQHLGFGTSSLQNCALLRHSVCRCVQVTKFWPMKWEQEWCVQLPDNVFKTKLLAFHVPAGRKMVTTEAVAQDSEMEATFWESWSALLAVEHSCLLVLASVRDKFLFYLKHCIFGFLCKYTLVKKKGLRM